VTTFQANDSLLVFLYVLIGSIHHTSLVSTSVPPISIGLFCGRKNSIL